MIQPILMALAVALMFFGAGTWDGEVFACGIVAAAAMGLEAAVQRS